MGQERGRGRLDVHRWGVDGNHFQERRIWQQAWLTATSDRERYLDDFFGGPFRSLHTLLELAADSVLPIEAITGTAEGEGPEGEVEIFIQPPRHVTEPKRRHPAELLFTLHGLGDRFADCLQRWHAGRERYGPTFDLFFSLGRSSLFLEHQFLSLIQAVEAYHRRAFPNYALPPEEHSDRERRVAEALAQAQDLSEVERRWVAVKIRYNEPRLVNRLFQIYDILPSGAQSALGSSDRFAHTIANTRHYMTHWDEDKRAQALIGTELLLGVQRLQLVIKVIFLRELGLATDEVVKRLREPATIKHLESSR